MDGGGPVGFGSVLVVFPASRSCTEVVRIGIELARAAGGDLVAVTIVGRPHPGVHMQGLGGRCVSTADGLRDQLTREGAARSRAAVEMVPANVSIESQVRFDRPDRAVQSQLQRRAIAHLVLHAGWSRRLWMRRAMRGWEGIRLPVELG